MSGSFVVAGSGAYRATKVGREAYAAKLAEEASKFTLVKSELRSGINTILQFITYLLVPPGLLIIYTQLFTTDAGWRESVLRHGRCAGADGARGSGADDVASRSPSAWSGSAGGSAWCRNCPPSRDWPASTWCAPTRPAR